MLCPVVSLQTERSIWTVMMVEDADEEQAEAFPPKQPKLSKNSTKNQIRWTEGLAMPSFALTNVTCTVYQWMNEYILLYSALSVLLPRWHGKGSGDMAKVRVTSKRLGWRGRGWLDMAEVGVTWQRLGWHGKGWGDMVKVGPSWQADFASQIICSLDLKDKTENELRGEEIKSQFWWIVDRASCWLMATDILSIFPWHTRSTSVLLETETAAKSCLKLQYPRLRT